MSIETRLRKLEGPLHDNDQETIDLVFLVGVKSANSEDYDQKEPAKLSAFCLHPTCDAREHDSLPGETVEQMAARLRAQHSEVSV